jgi:hypothetical protein
MWKLSTLALTLVFVACSVTGLVDSNFADGRSQAVAVPVGQAFSVTLGNVGPAQYASPPLISSPSIAFLGVDVVPPFNPGGPTQQFRFRAASPGLAIVSFQRFLGDSILSIVEDTVVVR